LRAPLVSFAVFQYVELYVRRQALNLRNTGRVITQGLLATLFMLVSCFDYYSTLKMVTNSAETSIDFQRTTWRYIPEDRILIIHAVRTTGLDIG
jgi:hypothetical protein